MKINEILIELTKYEVTNCDLKKNKTLSMQLQIIQQKIFEIRGQKVMLDFDLAALYEVETKVFNQAVKRNIESFPEDFMFRLSKDEWNYLRSQIVTSSLQITENQTNQKSQIVTSSHGGIRYIPYMLSPNTALLCSQAF